MHLECPGAYHSAAGVDLWQAFELSFLNARGKPLVLAHPAATSCHALQIALARFYISAASTCIFESKSFKLYLNSFAQSRFGDAQEAGGPVVRRRSWRVQVQELLQRDIAAAAQGDVRVELVLQADFAGERIADTAGTCVDGLDVEISHYSPPDPSVRRCMQC